MEQFDQMEQMHAQLQTSVPAADLTGTASQELGEVGGFEGAELYELEQVLDRDQIAVLTWAHHRLLVYAGSTETADGTIRAGYGVSATPDRSTEVTTGVVTHSDLDDQDASNDWSVEGQAGREDDPGIVGPVMFAVGFAPFSDGATGVGGAGTAGFMDWEGPITVGPVYDDRDALYVNGVLEAANIDDAAIHADLHVWHEWGIIED